MEKFAIVEIGSTNTKAYKYENGIIDRIGFQTIEFKTNYKKENHIVDSDKEALFEFLNSIKLKKIYVYGTSIFRNLSADEKDDWLSEFASRTSLDFNIVTDTEENELTTFGAVSNINYNGKIAVMIGGGGSTELSIVENKKVIEKRSFTFGAMDITDMFPELKTDKVKNDYDIMLNETKKMIGGITNKADILILAGGDYIYFYDELKYPVEKNKFYDSKVQPYCLDTIVMDKLDREFFYNISLEEVCKRTNNDAWWRGARGMRLCVKALSDVLDVKYIIPTRIDMVYGIVEKIKNDN